jgi:tol-pal system protein YbgF
MRLPFPTFVVLACLAAAPAAAQNREHVEIFADLRMLHEQLQKLQLAVNQLTTQLADANSRLDKQGEDARRSAADQKSVIDGMQTTLREIGERLDQSSVSISRVNSEIKVLRDALSMQQQLLNQILTLLQTNLAGAPPPAGSTGAGATGTSPPTTPPAGGGATLPPSPGEYWNVAWGYYASSKYNEAIAAFTEYLKQFPNSPDAPRAQMFIGDSQQSLNRFKDAIASYGVIITKYPDSDMVPDAYLKQGLSHQALKQIPEARRLYNLVISKYPKSDAAVFAAEHLKAIGKESSGG